MSNYLTRWVVVPLAFVLAGLAFIIRPAASLASDELASLAETNSAVFAGNYPADGDRYAIASASHPVYAVDSLTIDSISGTDANVSFNLRAYGSPRDYPALRITLAGTTGVRRTYVLAASQYPHEAQPLDERIHMPVPMRPGETRVFVGPVDDGFTTWIAPSGSPK